MNLAGDWGIGGALLHYCLIFLMVGGALLIYLYLWLNNKLQMDEEAKYQILEQNDE